MERTDVGRRMRAYRKKKGIDIRKMARLCGCSWVLLEAIETEGWITHPKIAARICKAYRLDVDGYNALVYEDYRAEQLPEPTPVPDIGHWRKYMKECGYYTRGAIT